MSDLIIPTGSIDAMAWAESFEAHKKKHQWTLDDIDAELMVGWFANYWAAVNDPLQKHIAELEGALKQYAEQTVGHPNVARIALEPKGGDDEPPHR